MLPVFNKQRNFWERVWEIVFCLSAFIPLALLAFLINAIQIVFLPLLFIAPKLSRKLHQGVGYTWWCIAVVVMEKIKKIEFVYTGADVPLSENVILIGNHQSMADVAPILALAYHKKSLPYLKWFAKDILKYVPGMGWGLYFAGNFFVKRDWLRDQRKIDKVFENVLKFREPMWLVSFLEGTRITADKLKKSQIFSKDRQRPVLKHLLAPRTKGFEAAIKSLRTHLDAVYDITIAFPEGTPDILTFFSGCIHRIDVHVRRFPIDSIPFTDKEISDWVWKVFEEKDELIKYFIRHHRFPA